MEGAPSPAGVRAARRQTLLLVLVSVALLGAVLLVYEQARSEVPRHRAALERLVRAQTGLDVRFAELALRWGWYGPEVILQRVELQQPGATTVLLRAPQLVVGFDAWRSVRTGHPELGRIALIAPEIDLHSSAAQQRRALPDAARAAGSAPQVLQRWRGGRIDIEGGTVHLALTDASAAALSLQIRRATLRHSDEDWSVDALLFLPERIGRAARIVAQLSGDLSQPGQLRGSLQVDARRLTFAGCALLLAGQPQWRPYVPSGGGGDLSLRVRFAHGALLEASGSVRAADVSFAPGMRTGALTLDRVRAHWQAVHDAGRWQIDVDGLQFARDAPPATMRLSVEDTGTHVHGDLHDAPLMPLVALSHWLVPAFDLPGVELAGSSPHLQLDWDARRVTGERLHAQGRFTQLALSPRSGDFTLRGLEAQVTGTEEAFEIRLGSQAAVLELAAAPQYPLEALRVDSILHLAAGREGWMVSTERFHVGRGPLQLQLAGTAHGGAQASIAAHGRLSGLSIPLAEHLLGGASGAAFGAAASQLTAGEIDDAQFELRGPLTAVPFSGHNLFAGSLELRDGMLSGGGLWPDVRGVDAHVSWHDAHFLARIDGAQAGTFRIAGASAAWDASGAGPTHLSGQIAAPLEDALAWLRTHPQLQRYAPGLGEVDARGDADVSVAADIAAPHEGATGHDVPAVDAYVSAQLRGVDVAAVAGLPRLEQLGGVLSFAGGHLQRSVLQGQWLGGPVTLRLGERRQGNEALLAVRAAGELDAARLVEVANLPAAAAGSSSWRGELTYPLPQDAAADRHWRMRLQSDLTGLASTLPEPLGKAAGAALPVVIEVSGDEAAAQGELALGDRLRSVLQLACTDGKWSVARGTINFGSTRPSLPPGALLLVQGRLGRLDLPAYAFAWQRMRADLVPAVRAEAVAGVLQIGARSYPEAHVSARRSPAGSELRLDAAGIAGSASWPAAVTTTSGTDASDASAEIHLERLELPDGSVPSEGLVMLAALGPAAHLAVDDLNWRGHPIGRLTARFERQEQGVRLADVHLQNAIQDARGALACDLQTVSCQLQFRLVSEDARATLESFDLRPELTARHALVGGTLEWQPGAPSWLASLQGTLALDIRDGHILRTRGSDRPARALALLTVPALVGALRRPSGMPAGAEATAVSLAKDADDMAFSRLQADFQLHNGEASTSNLHLDGDAEILVRGRTGLLARDYDDQVWVLGGEERLPETLRRLLATPRIASVWLSLRDLVLGHENDPHGHAILRLQGSWDDPMVSAAR